MPSPALSPPIESKYCVLVVTAIVIPDGCAAQLLTIAIKQSQLGALERYMTGSAPNVEEGAVQKSIVTRLLESELKVYQTFLP